MIGYTILAFFGYLGWMIGGLAIHFTGNMAIAKTKKKGFTFKIFYDRNWCAYLYSLISIGVLSALFAVSRSQFKEIAPVNIMGIIDLSYHYWLVSIGFSGGEVLKKLLKRKE